MIDRFSCHRRHRHPASRQRPLRPWAAFTLVEVSLALGVIAFCTVALIGMVPVGLQSERLSYDQMQATHLLNEIQKDFSSIAKPYSDPSNPSAASPTPGQVLPTTLRFKIFLSVPGQPVPLKPPDYTVLTSTGVFYVDDSFLLSLETAAVPANAPVVVPANARYVVYYDYNDNLTTAPPANVPYRVRVMVAWPATAKFTGSGTGLTLTGARGYVETVMTINRF